MKYNKCIRFIKIIRNHIQKLFKTAIQLIQSR